MRPENRSSLKRRWRATSVTRTARMRWAALRPRTASTCASGRADATGSGASPSTFFNLYNQVFSLARISGQTYEVRPQGKSAEYQAPGAQPADALEAALRVESDSRLARGEGPLRGQGGAQPDGLHRGQDGHKGNHPPQHRRTIQIAPLGADVQGHSLVAGLLQRLLTRSGILPVLRSQWRADQTAAAAKLEKRLDKHLTELKGD